MSAPKYGLTVGNTITQNGEAAFFLGVVGDRLKGPRAIPSAEVDALAKRVCEAMNADPDPLCEVLRKFCAEHHLPHMSADDMLRVCVLTQAQRDWLEAYCDLWDARQDLEEEGE